MRRIAAVVVLLWPAVTLAFQNEPTGFRGIEWGTPVESVPGLEIAHSDGDKVGYHRPGDKLEIGGAKLSILLYTFYKGKFDGAIIGTKGISNKRELQQAVFAQFGEGYRANRYLESWSWHGKSTIILLKCGPVDTDCHFSLSSADLWKQQKADLKARGDAAKKDF